MTKKSKESQLDMFQTNSQPKKRIYVESDIPLTEDEWKRSIESFQRQQRKYKQYEKTFLLTGNENSKNLFTLEL